MKQEDAVRHLRAMTTAIQRLRSIAKEQLSNEGYSQENIDDALGILFPWLFSEKCPLSVLMSALDDVENGKKLDTLFFSNMIFVATRLQPEISIIASSDDPDFPKDIGYDWLPGWEE
jgi:hypothetical protein